MESIWTLVVIAGPIILAAALIFGMVRSRRLSAAARARTEQGARDVYAEEDRRSDT